MRTRVLFALVLLAALPVVANAQATTPCGSTPMTAVPATPTFMSGTQIGGPMFAASPMYGNYTVVERTGPLGFMRWRTVEPAPTVMPAPVMMATGAVPATATMTSMPMSTGVITGGYATSPMVGGGYTVVERTGPLGFMRWRTLEPTMTTTEDSSMTPTQAANFRILRRVIFGGGGDSCLPAVARDAPGWADQQHASRTIAVEAGRHRACGRSGAVCSRGPGFRLVCIVEHR